MKRYCILLVFILNSLAASAQTPDWSSQIAGIIYNNCSTCHHEGGVAPFSLMSYTDAFDNAFSIQAVVNAHKMPPWPPDPNYSHFRDEKILFQTEIEAINNWVNGGMPLGNPDIAPEPPVFNGLSEMVGIQDTVKMPAYTVTQDADDFRTFVVPSGYTETKYINQIEVIPGDYSMVHHLFIYQDSSDISATDDSLSPGPGFPSGGLGIYSPYARLVGGWIPGSGIFYLPSNMGLEIPAQSDFAVAFHYSPNSIGKTDSTKINIRFAEADVIRPISVSRFLYWHPPSLIDGPLNIPANQVKTFHEQSEIFSIDKSMVALQPHCHLLGKSWKVFMVTAPGDTTNLIYIPDWKFEWQMCYFFNKVMKIPAGAQIFGEAVFDNTINNPNNPSNPPQNVFAGETTFDEMMSCRFWMLDYQQGDEDIVLDSSYYTAANTPDMTGVLPLKIIPNPSRDFFYFTAMLPEHEITWTLTNQYGMIVRSKHQASIPKGAYAEMIDLTLLPSGTYYLSVASGHEHTIEKAVIIR